VDIVLGLAELIGRAYTILDAGHVGEGDGTRPAGPQMEVKVLTRKFQGFVEASNFLKT